MTSKAIFEDKGVKARDRDRGKIVDRDKDCSELKPSLYWVESLYWQRAQYRSPAGTDTALTTPLPAPPAPPPQPTPPEPTPPPAP